MVLYSTTPGPLFSLLYRRTLTMQSFSISEIKYLDASELHQWLKNGYTTTLHEPFQVIDVRGSDYIGGHIAGAWNYPYKRLKNDVKYIGELRNRLLEEHMQSSDETNQSVVNCVFHCAQSQQRGPSSAMRFLRSLTEHQLCHFRIWILRGGFNHWQSIYGQDSSLTVDYVPDIWQWQ
ncbi:phosphatase YCH1 Ecym_7376 [Eremothecium cymbalariae DBVPG|uniref:Rhodanese domain-containing protein n=1 Tax=Eremothecium cymbalariae (strain CBS 270.75 / DBVPG 7215 / KCTC 17166 / NRRL Y-17582) TaxID=931890 RepID=G8JWI7_ERECY|nr:hypothetical protein Ecym_7376 [Eremothecium cymbalariae DBVPG\